MYVYNVFVNVRLLSTRGVVRFLGISVKNDGLKLKDEWTFDDASWENVPEIRLIVAKRVLVGPGAPYAWMQRDMKGPYWRIYWNDVPGAFVACDGRELELTPDRVVALSPDAVYDTRAERQVGHFYVHCFVSEPFADIKDRMFMWEDPELVRHASLLATTRDDQSFRTRTRLLAYLHLVLLSIPEEDIPASVSYSPKIAKALDILKRGQIISNTALSRRVGMSRNGFLALFKKETHTSPQAFSRQLRINEACVMLHAQNKTIDEIAKATGFCDRYHFSRVFRRTIGSSPGFFRTSVRQKT